MPRNSSPPAPPDGKASPPRGFFWVDAFIILLVLTGTALTLPAFRALTPDRVAIFRDNRQIAVYPLAENRVITVDGVIGPVEVVIKNGAVSITRSTCPHGICMKSGPIRRPRAQIVCAPNHILVTVTSSGNDTLDAIVR
ncbi:MAG: NusG domain II-containing protein [Chitinispirillaceae bacterium]|nr:NusG domain II-containing protein [Chitinispirillaceae bacterium]